MAATPSIEVGPGDEKLDIDEHNKYCTLGQAPRTRWLGLWCEEEAKLLMCLYVQLLYGFDVSGVDLESVEILGPANACFKITK